MTTTPTNPFTRFLHRLESKDSKTSNETHNFEESIGVEYRKIGRLHCWQAKGTVRRSFLVLKDHIKEHLEEHGDVVSTPVIWQVYMIGKSRKSAYPVIFFCSKEADARKTVRKQIEESKILANFPGFKTGDCTRPLEFDELKPLAADRMEVSQPSAIQNVECGNPVGCQIEIQQGLDRRVNATVGAVFNWDGLLVFITAAHAFFEHDLMLNFDDDDENDFELSFEEGALDAGHDELSEGSDEDKAVDGFDQQSNNESSAQNVNTLGRHSGVRNSGLSGALTYTPDDVVLSSKDGPNPALDYCLVMLKGNQLSARGLPHAYPHCDYHAIQPRMRATQTPRDAQVIAYTGSGTATRGMLSGTPTIMTLPGGKKTQELWSVKLKGTVSEGDCGSIVVNEETGNLEGHIVAGCPGSGNAYIIPAHGVLQDIRRRFSSRLQIWNRFPHCTPRVRTTAISGREASALTRTFRETLSEARKAKLAKAFQKSPPLLWNPSSPIIHNIPISPQQPQSQKSIRFKDLLWSLSSKPFQWNNPDLLDEALAQLPLDMLHRQAEKEFEIVRADAKAHSPARRPILGFEDCVIKALLRWFKRSFFQWVDNPACSFCGSRTTGIGMAVPQADELAGGARAVEAYRCENRYCGNFERFPRYNDPFVLMRTRKGRSGEWTQCFSMLCHALGARVRLVWNAEDHVWTEVYSKHQKRWIHADAHAEAWDEPKIYCEGKLCS